MRVIIRPLRLLYSRTEPRSVASPVATKKSNRSLLKRHRESSHVLATHVHRSLLAFPGQVLTHVQKSMLLVHGASQHSGDLGSS